MKKIILFFAAIICLAGATAAQAETQNCTVLRVFDTSYFEESLSKHEYPNLVLTRSSDYDFTLDIGANALSSEYGDVLRIEASLGMGENYSVWQKDDKDVLYLNFIEIYVQKKRKSFTYLKLLVQKYNGNKKPTTVKLATFRCD